MIGLYMWIFIIYRIMIYQWWFMCMWFWCMLCVVMHLNAWCIILYVLWCIMLYYTTIVHTKYFLWIIVLYTIVYVLSECGYVICYYYRRPKMALIYRDMWVSGLGCPSLPLHSRSTDSVARAFNLSSTELRFAVLFCLQRLKKFRHGLLNVKYTQISHVSTAKNGHRRNQDNGSIFDICLNLEMSFEPVLFMFMLNISY